MSTRAARAVARASKDRYHARSVAQHVAKLCDALSDPSEVVDALMNSGSAPLVAAAVSIASEKWASAAAFLRLEAPSRSAIERVAKSLAKTEPQQRVGPFIYISPRRRRDRENMWSRARGRSSKLGRPDLRLHRGSLAADARLEALPFSGGTRVVASIKTRGARPAAGRGRFLVE